MLYLATASTERVRDAMHASPYLGQMVTPDSGNRLEPGVKWALDNGCFSAKWEPHRWLDTVRRYAHESRRGCLFAVVPDVVADSATTRTRWDLYAGIVAWYGYRPAYVLQDGETGPPWTEMGALFIGGSTAYKLSADARRFALEAKERGLWLHMGRVNSLRRLRYAKAVGCDSVDGTYLAFGPDTNLPKLLTMLGHAVGQQEMPGCFT